MWKLVGLLAWIILVGCSQDQTRSEKVSSKIVASDEDSVSQQPNPKITWRTDGAKMRCIPAGASTPVFHMDRTEVTAGQFKKFLQESEYSYEGIGMQSANSSSQMNIQ